MVSNPVWSRNIALEFRYSIKKLSPTEFGSFVLLLFAFICLGFFCGGRTSQRNETFLTEAVGTCDYRVWPFGAAAAMSLCPQFNKWEVGKEQEPKASETLTHRQLNPIIPPKQKAYQIASLKHHHHPEEGIWRKKKGKWFFTAVWLWNWKVFMCGGKHLSLSKGNRWKKIYETWRASLIFHRPAEALLSGASWPQLETQVSSHGAPPLLPSA